MYLRSLSGTTLEDLRAKYDTRQMVWGGGAHQIEPNIDGDAPSIRFGSHETIVTEGGLKSLATFFDIPPKFLAGRLDREQQQYLLRTQIEKVDTDLTILWNESGISEVRKADEVRVRPHRLVEKAISVMGGDAMIVDEWNDAVDLRIDVIFPEGHEKSGGDVGDLTRGGVRIGQNRKANTAPWLQPFLYRLVCTNGMEIPDTGLKISALGASEVEIEALFEAELSRAVDRLVGDIEAFYDLRTQTLGNDPTGALRRAALEQNLPTRTVGNLEDLVPSLIDQTSGEITMFDVVNLMTNQANNPAIDLRSSTRRNLQRAGGNLVNDHAERCGQCHSRLGG